MGDDFRLLVPRETQEEIARLRAENASLHSRVAELESDTVTLMTHREVAMTTLEDERAEVEKERAQRNAAHAEEIRALRSERDAAREALAALVQTAADLCIQSWIVSGPKLEVVRQSITRARAVLSGEDAGPHQRPTLPDAVELLSRVRTAIRAESKADNEHICDELLEVDREIYQFLGKLEERL